MAVASILVCVAFITSLIFGFATCPLYAILVSFLIVLHAVASGKNLRVLVIKASTNKY